MRLRVVFIFISSILIPTALLSYFGLLAVRSEKAIVEKSVEQRYVAMVDIVESDINRVLTEMPPELRENRKYLESVLTGQTYLFKDEIEILDKEGRMIGKPGRSFAVEAGSGLAEKPVLTRPIKGVPYTMAVYEKYPLSLGELEERKKGPYLYIALIAFSASAILFGGFFTMWALSRQWRLAELKSNFVLDLSHDLKKPLTSIRMFSEMLKDNRVPAEEKKREYYEIISGESEKLTHLANNILDFSRIESGRKKYDMKPADIANVTAETVERFKHYMIEKPRRVTLDIKERFPALNIDAAAISQAIMNLLINAAKYSPPEKEININLVKAAKEVRIEIVDCGIGIPGSKQKKIFQKFYRVSQKSVPETEGSGLGLTVVKYISGAHRGRVEVESEEGKGSKFSLILPI